MARPYRKVAKVTEDLRLALGCLAACDPATPATYFAAVGAVKVVIEAALDDLQADRTAPPSGAFERGYDHVSALFQPLPGMEAIDGR
jgi:hypothetical protein